MPLRSHFVILAKARIQRFLELPDPPSSRRMTNHEIIKSLYSASAALSRKLSKQDIEGTEAAVALSGGDKGDDMFSVAA